MFPRQALEIIFRHQRLFQPRDTFSDEIGIVIGYGYTLRTKTPAQFVRDWNGLLPAGQLGRLLAVVGENATHPGALMPMLADIEIPAEAAQVVWVLTELSRLECDLDATFPGASDLPDLARGALISLIDDRGTNLGGDCRREMAEIRTVLGDRDHGPASKCRIAAHLVRCMKRIYPVPGGIPARDRREAEAELLDTAANAF